jgi:hypothetical protein
MVIVTTHLTFPKKMGTGNFVNLNKQHCAVATNKTLTLLKTSFEVGYDIACAQNAEPEFGIILKRWANGRKK